MSTLYADKLELIDEVFVEDLSGSHKYNGNKTQILGKVLAIASTPGLGDEVLFTRNLYDNDLLLTGRTYVAEKMCNKRSSFTPTSLDVEYNVNLQSEIQRSVATLKEEDIIGIIVGDGGCNETYNQINAVNITARKVPGMLPFRQVTTTTDLIGSERDQYFLRKVDTTKVYYYGKKFEIISEPKMLFADGTEVPNTVDQTIVTKDIMSYIEYKATISAKDIREYFLNRDGNTNNSRISTIGIIAGYPIIKNDKTEYANVRCITTVNMNFSDLKDNQSTVTFIYRVYLK